MKEDKTNFFRPAPLKRSGSFGFKTIFLLCSVLFGIFICQKAEAATSYFSPSSGNFTVGNIFTVNILVNTEDAAINNAEAIINFPGDLLEIVSVSKSGSIFSLWVEEPNFSNSAGKLSFNGGLPTPGYNGAAGKVLSAVFRAKNEGSASLVFSSVAIRANDGYGTNVFRGSGQATFNLTLKEKAPPAEVAPPAAQVPLAPKVSSETHPDSAKWYANNNPSFSWVLTKDITGVNVLADRNPNSNPGTKSDGMRTSYTFKDVDEGAWYFHIRLKNSAGWGAIAHFGFNIDTVSPAEPKLTIIAVDAYDPKPFLKVESSDAASGIDYYEISFDGKTEKWQDDGSGKYQFAGLDPGEHKITVKVFDKAGNYSAGEITHTVGALESLTMNVPEHVAYGSKIPVSGTSKYPNAKVYISVTQNSPSLLQQIVETDNMGNFATAIKNKLAEGSYKVSGYLMDARGAKSATVEKMITIYAVWYIRVLSILAANILWIIILLLLLLILFFIFWYFLAFMRKKKKARKKELYINKLNIWDLLSELEKHIVALEKTRHKRHLELRESILYLRFRKMKKMLAKYLARRANGKKK